MSSYCPDSSPGPEQGIWGFARRKQRFDYVRQTGRLLSAKWLQKHAKQPEFFGIAEPLDAQSDSVVPGGGLGAVGAEEPVPNRQIKSEITVGFRNENRVMHTMHVGRDHEPAKQALQSGGDKDIAVVEHRGGIEQKFEEKHTQRRRSDDGDRAKFDYEREENFDGVKARAGGDVDIEVGVVHAMEPPKDRLIMKRPMLEVNHQIEHKDGSGDGNPAGHRCNVEQTPPMILHPESEADGARWNEKSHHEAINERDPDIRGPAGTPLQGGGPSRKKALTNRKKRQDSKITGEPDERFVFEQGRSHGNKVEKNHREAMRNDSLPASEPVKPLP